MSEEAATAAFDTSARTADRRFGACRGLASQPGCKADVVHAALRGQKTASSGTRPEPLVEVSEPQVGAVTVGHVAAPGPLLVVASLAGGDEVDATTVSFLLRENLRRKNYEEDEKEREASVGGEGEGGAREGDAGAQTPCQARRVAQRG